AVARAADRLRGLGHRVWLDPGALGRHTRFAGTDDERIAAIGRVAARDDVDVAVALRGGYGTTRLLERLDYEALARGGMVTYAGPTFAYDFGAETPSAFTLTHCFGLLGGSEYDVACALDGPTHGRAEGVLWGGNLAMVA